MPERIASGEPQEMGRHKRLHLTLKQETGSLRAQIGRFDAFPSQLQPDRPHEALGQRPPITPTVARRGAGTVGCVSPSMAAMSRSAGSAPTARSNGRASPSSSATPDHSLITVRTLTGEPVGLRPVEAGLYDVWYGPIWLAGIDHRGRLTRDDPPTPPKPMDLMENASALPTTPQARQPPLPT